MTLALRKRAFAAASAIALLGFAAAVPQALVAQDGTASSAAEQAPRTSERSFAEQTIARFSRALPSASFVQEPGDPLQVNVTGHPEWGEATLNLHRLFAHCQTIPAAECTAELERLVIALTARPAEPRAEKLRIIVRDAQYWAYTEQLAGAEGALPIHRRIGEDLYAILAIDSPQTIRVAVLEDLQALGLDEQRAWDRAAEQTGLVIPALPIGRDFGAGLLAFGGDEYTGSMLLFLPQWEQIAARAGADLAVAVTSDQLVVAGLVPAGQALEEFKQLVAEDCAAVPRCISPNVYRLRQGQWAIAD